MVKVDLRKTGAVKSAAVSDVAVPVSSGITAWSEFFSCLNCMLPSNNTTDTVFCMAAHTSINIIQL